VQTVYDKIGAGYSTTRRPDDRIAARILEALHASESIVNVGAGGGSYEPKDRFVIAVEPSATMIRQRPSGSAPVVQAAAEALPFIDGAFWRRPAAYLDPQVRAGISTYTLMPQEIYMPGLERLSADLQSGKWQDQHRNLLKLEELDLGYRLVIVD
jgi:hypothetical protein